MNADEIVRALREMLPPKVDYAKLVCAEGFAHGQCYVWDDPEPYIISAAADLIESQQANLRHEEKVSHGQMEQNKRLRKMVDELQANLAESQRRERAAVEDIEKMMRICEKGSCHFCANGDCTESPYCNPKWRGPKAGKGEAE